MTTIVLRALKGIPLTIAEADANFSNLNNDKVEVADAVPESLSGKVVRRDANGSFSANVVSASLNGNAATSTKFITARTINGVSFDGTENISVTANTTNTLTRGSYLTGSNFNGSTATTWAVDATSANTAGKVVARDGSGNFSANEITATLNGNASTSTLAGNVTGIVSIANGGTGSSTAATARDALGLEIGVDIQPFNSNLSAVSSVSTNGFYSRTSNNTAAARTITAGDNIVVSNGNGVAGNPTVALADSPAFSGTPTATTQDKNDSSTRLATTAFVQLQKDSPAFTGTPTAPTRTTTDSSTALATTAFVQAQKVSPAFTGTPTAPTPGTANNSTTLATTAFVQAQKESPVFTGSPVAPTQTINDNSTKLATTAFVQAQKNSPAFTGTPTAPTAPLEDVSTKLATTAFVKSAIFTLTPGVKGHIMFNASGVASNSKYLTVSRTGVGQYRVFLDPLIQNGTTNFTPILGAVAYYTGTQGASNAYSAQAEIVGVGVNYVDIRTSLMQFYSYAGAADDALEVTRFYQFVNDYANYISLAILG